ncbi:MAG: hypothetical protein AAF270_03560 [Pseudomonadota bacterium]
MVISAIGLLVSFWNRNDLPGNVALLPAIDSEPVQRATQHRSFDANWLGERYEIKPQYDYDITGMIVSYRHHDGNSRMHARSADHLNMLDVCVVWGDSANNPLLDKIKFWNGIFTCNFRTRDQRAWELFDIYQISNNHLLSDDPLIRDRVGDIRIGDQIRVRGWLSSYVSPNGSERGTSVTRKDTGDGACETIYVDAFDIVQPALSYWRIGMWFFLALFAASLAAYFMAPHRPHRDR